MSFSMCSGQVYGSHLTTYNHLNCEYLILQGWFQFATNKTWGFLFSRQIALLHMHNTSHNT